jgi:hypothetical protein
MLSKTGIHVYKCSKSEIGTHVLDLITSGDGLT